MMRKPLHVCSESFMQLFPAVLQTIIITNKHCNTVRNTDDRKQYLAETRWL